MYILVHDNGRSLRCHDGLLAVSDARIELDVAGGVAQKGRRSRRLLLLQPPHRLYHGSSRQLYSSCSKLGAGVTNVGSASQSA